jgi:coenzyme F420-reducing hydrogenase alpha subunit
VVGDGGGVGVIEELVKYSPEEYPDVVAEHIEPWTYLKFPYTRRQR